MCSSDLSCGGDAPSPHPSAVRGAGQAMASGRTGRRSASPSVEDDPPRTLRVVFQRRCPEEQALRRAGFAELLAEEHEPDLSLQDPDPLAPGERNHEGFGPPPGGGIGARLRAPAAHSLDGPLRFSSAFECGNLLLAKMVVSGRGGSSSSTSKATDASPREGPTAAPAEGSGGEAAAAVSEVEYDLHLDSDTQSSVGHTQWFYFAVRTNDFRGRLNFRIVNLRKKKSLYQHGMHPHSYSLRRNKGWEPFSCEDIVYGANSDLPPRYKRSDQGIRPDLHTLSFTCNVTELDDEIYFAAYPPYTYSMMSGFLAKLGRHAFARKHFVRSELCRSIGQLPVPHLLIAEDVATASSERSGGVNEGAGAAFFASSPASPAGRLDSRPAIVVIARQHPGEVVGSWAVQGFLKFLLGPSAVAKLLRQAYVFHVIPMVNVDGVVYGNSRCTLAGVDPNRVWHDPNPIIHPVIYALKNHLRSISSGSDCKGIELFLDMHGHSAKSGCFFYGSNPNAPIANAVFPKLCAIATRDISFEQCHWRCQRSHRKTARYVVYKQCNVKYSYTMECSLFAPVGWSTRVASSSPAYTPRSSPSPDGEVRWEGARETARTSTASALGHFTPERVEWIGFAVGYAAATFLGINAEHPHGKRGSPPPPLPRGGDVVDVPPPGGGEVAGACCCRRCAEECEADVAFLKDASCPQVLAKRPWMPLRSLDTTSFDEVLDDLANAYGDIVPDFARCGKGDDSDGGDSDGDDMPEPEVVEPLPRHSSKDAAGKDAIASAAAGTGCAAAGILLAAASGKPPAPPIRRDGKQSVLRLAVPSRGSAAVATSQGSSPGGSVGGSSPSPAAGGRGVPTALSPVPPVCASRGVVGLQHTALATATVMLGRRVLSAQPPAVSRSKSVDHRNSDGSPADLFAEAPGPKLQWPPPMRMDAKSAAAGRAAGMQFWVDDGSKLPGNGCPIAPAGSRADSRGEADLAEPLQATTRSTPSPTLPAATVGMLLWDHIATPGSQAGEWVSCSAAAASSNAAGMPRAATQQQARRRATVDYSSGASVGRGGASSIPPSQLYNAGPSDELRGDSATVAVVRRNSLASRGSNGVQPAMPRPPRGVSGSATERQPRSTPPLLRGATVQLPGAGVDEERAPPAEPQLGVLASRPLTGRRVSAQLPESVQQENGIGFGIVPFGGLARPLDGSPSRRAPALGPDDKRRDAGAGSRRRSGEVLAAMFVK